MVDMFVRLCLHGICFSTFNPVYYFYRFLIHKPNPVCVHTDRLALESSGCTFPVPSDAIESRDKIYARGFYAWR